MPPSFVISNKNIYKNLATAVGLCYHKVRKARGALKKSEDQQILESGEMKMYIERTWENGKAELFNMEAGTVLRMHEGLPSCWFLEVDMGGKVYVLLQNTSITIIQQKYQAIKAQWVGGKDVVAITD